MVRFISFLILILVPFLTAAYAEAVGGQSAGDKQTLIVGYSSRVLFDVDINDARAATKVWIDILVKKQNVFAKSEAIVFTDLSSLEKAVRTKTVDVITMLPHEPHAQEHRGFR